VHLIGAYIRETTFVFIRAGGRNSIGWAEICCPRLPETILSNKNQNIKMKIAFSLEKKTAKPIYWAS